MTTPLSDERIAEIRARERAATPGPWHVTERSDHLAYAVRASDEEHSRLVCEVNRRTVGYLAKDTSPVYNDDAFIASARTDVPDLLAEVERLRARVAELEDIDNRVQAMADRMAEQAADNLLRAREAERRVARLEGVLREVEWIEAMDGRLYCEVCKRERPYNHLRDCALDAALRGAGG